MRWMTAVPLALLLGACSPGGDTTQRSVWVADGAEVNCISTNRIRSFRVIDDRTVDFEVNRNRVYRNRLPFSCNGLLFNQSIRHNSRTSSLCSSDTITVINPGVMPNGPTCNLGRFQPMKRAPAPDAPA